jgi:hypothetical protein
LTFALCVLTCSSPKAKSKGKSQNAKGKSDEVVMPNNIAKPEDFRRALESANIERVELPSGLSVLLCRPPVFAALSIGRVGTQLQSRVTDIKPEDIQADDIEAFTKWLTQTLERFFVQPRFSASPQADEIGLADILIEDLQFIFRWLRGEVFSEKLEARSEKLEENSSSSSLLTSRSSTEDLGRFPGRQRAAGVPGGGSEAQSLPPERTPGAHRDAGLPAGLQRG